MLTKNFLAFLNLVLKISSQFDSSIFTRKMSLNLLTIWTSLLQPCKKTLHGVKPMPCLTKSNEEEGNAANSWSRKSRGQNNWSAVDAASLSCFQPPQATCESTYNIFNRDLLSIIIAFQMALSLHAVSTPLLSSASCQKNPNVCAVRRWIEKIWNGVSPKHQVY